MKNNILVLGKQPAETPALEVETYFVFCKDQYVKYKKGSTGCSFVFTVQFNNMRGTVVKQMFELIYVSAPLILNDEVVKL